VAAVNSRDGSSDEDPEGDPAAEPEDGSPAPPAGLAAEDRTPPEPFAAHPPTTASRVAETTIARARAREAIPTR
jgi:hypothetical protein